MISAYVNIETNQTIAKRCHTFTVPYVDEPYVPYLHDSGVNARPPPPPSYGHHASAVAVHPAGADAHDVINNSNTFVHVEGPYRKYSLATTDT